MKRPSFFEGVGVAFVASAAGGVLFGVLSTLFAGGFVIRLLTAAISLGYLLYLLSRSQERVGRITVIAAWAVMAAAIWFLSPSFALYLLLHIGLIWLVRALYYYSGVIPALMDLGLNALAFTAAIWAAVQTESVFLSLWCFFLVQALFVTIPSRIRRKKVKERAEQHDQDRFQQAHRAAQAAVRKLSSVQ
jgi:beta-lactamase regulating signal transducer with metallopeptidase domain